MITGFVNGQRLKLGAPVVAADTIDYLTAQFVFQTADWLGLEVWSHWQNGAEVYDIPLEDGRITEAAHLNLGAGTWNVWLHGNRYADGAVVQRITTEKARVEVVPTGSLDGEPFPEIPASVAEQIFARLENVEENGPGGLSPVDKTDAMTAAVGRDTDGRLWTAGTGKGVKTVSIHRNELGIEFSLILEDGSKIGRLAPMSDVRIEDTAPTSETSGAAGELLFDTTGEVLYVCRGLWMPAFGEPGYVWTAVGGGSGLPDITDADEGALLRVVDGDAEWVPDESVRYIPSQTLRVGDNVLTDGMVTLGAGWSGNLTDGFTHTSGTEPLVFAVGAADGESYIIDADYTGYGEGRVALSLGASYETDPYNGNSHLRWGLTCVGNDGTLKITPANYYTGVFTNLTFRKVTEDGENEVEIELSDIYHTDMPNHLSGAWNIAMGGHALENSVNGSRNIALGYVAQRLLKSGGRNIAIGTFSMSQMESGENNLGVGADSFFVVKKARNCIAFGKSALAHGAEYNDNIAIGNDAMYGASGESTTSKQNIAIGNSAGYYGGGTGNVFIGTQTGYKNGNNLNTFIGHQAGKEATGWGNTAIGRGATTNSYSLSTAIGANASATRSNQVVVGSAADTKETRVFGDMIVVGTDGVKRQIVFNAGGTCGWTEVS